MPELAEKRTVIYSGEQLEYILTKKKVKNFNLRVKSDGSVHLSVNKRFSASVADDFIIKNMWFIKKNIIKFKNAQTEELPPKQYISGEKFYYLGKAFLLVVVKSYENKMYFKGDNLYLEVINEDDFKLKAKIADNWYKKHALEVFKEIVIKNHAKFEKYNIAVPELKMRTMKTMWGSCRPSKKSITLNKNLVYTPLECIEYVVAHEYVHFIHPNHSNSFYAFLVDMMPDWKDKKKVLEEFNIKNRSAFI